VNLRILCYVYPGWHPIAERDESFYPGFTEWELVYQCRPRFAGHAQPRLPLWGRYDDRDPAVVEHRIQACRQHGIDGFVYGFFWCRGKRVFQEALDQGFLGAPSGGDYPFALMWANRMPRRVLPVTRSDLPVIEADRRVDSDREDFVRFTSYVAERYFTRPNYVRVHGKAYLSIFDSTFFVRELGVPGAREAVAAARAALARARLPELHLAAIDPQPEVIGQLAHIGFDSVTHYVHLPAWKGPALQDYEERARVSAASWPSFALRSGLPYHPSVSPGWDASPRGADFGPARPDKYPWSPVVTGEHPDKFRQALARAVEFERARDRIVFVASLNEWSEGHSIEPDERFGMAWLEAIRAARAEREN
jgi:hypothetical protein